jgi:hypothetical protein
MSSTKTDFTSEEWETFRNAPYLAAAAVMMAGRSGIFGSIKEVFVTAHTLYESTSSDSPLIKALSTPEEVKRGQEFVSNQVSFRDAAQAPQKLHRLAVEHCQTAVGLLRQKGDLAEAERYKRWVLEIAQKVANAAKEGAFFGLGGERVSEAEQAVLTDLAAALQGTVAPAAVHAPRGA